MRQLSLVQVALSLFMRLKDIRATWHLAWPIVIGQLATTGTTFIDTVMAGHYSAGDLAAVSVGSSIWVTLSITMMGYLLAINPIIAHKVGANEFAAIPSLTQQALIQSLIVAAMAFLAAHLLLPIFTHLGLEPHIASKAADFLKAISWGLPAFALYRVLYNYSAALNQTKPMMVISIFCLLLNIPANWVLIYGYWGFPELGGVGCGWATAFCVWINFILLVIWILHTKRYKSTHPFRAWQGWDSQTHWQIFKLGLPIGIMFLVEVSAFSLIALIIAKLGTDSVAAHQIAINFSTLTFMIPMAIATALTVRVGHAVGASDFAQARFIGQNGTQFGLCVAALTGGLMIFASNWIASLYTNDAAVLAIAGHLIVLAGIFQFSDSTQVVSSGILRGYKITRLPMILHMTSFWVIAMPIGYLLTFGVHDFQGIGVRGFWIALIIGLTAAALSLQFLFQRISKQKLLKP